MEKKIIEGLSRSDFGALKSVSRKEDNTFSYALIQYRDSMCMINSEEYYQLFLEGKVMPKTIHLLEEERMTYEKDENKNPKVGPDGKKILVGTGKLGYSIINAVGLDMAQNESKMRIIASTMQIQESTAIAIAKTDLAKAVHGLAKYDLTAAQVELINSRVLDPEDEEDDDPEAGGDPNNNAAVGAGADAAGGAAS